MKEKNTEISQSANIVDKTNSNSSSHSYHSRYTIITKHFTYNNLWDYIEQCDLEQVELVMGQALVDPELNDYQRREIMFKYGRRRQAILHYPTDFNQDLREKTIQMNQHLSQKCIQGGRIMLDLLQMAKERGLGGDKLQLSMDIRVSAYQPWDADELERAMVSGLMDYNLVVKSYYNNDSIEEYTDRNKILGLNSDDDNWNECLPEQWSEGMQLTFPFDRIRDGVPLSWERLTQIRNYDIIIEESLDL